MEIDRVDVDVVWNRAWPDCRPIAHEFRFCVPDRWLRIHSLSKSKRYAETAEEYTEILNRHNSVISYLVATCELPTYLFVVTCAWSPTSVPLEMDLAVVGTSSEAVYWKSLREDEGDAEGWWTHLYVQMVSWKVGILDQILRIVVDDAAEGVFFAPVDFQWLYHPYDGGSDIVAPSSDLCQRLRIRYRDWLPEHSDGQDPSRV